MTGKWIWIGFGGGGKLPNYLKFEDALYRAPDEKALLLDAFYGPRIERGDNWDMALSVPIWQKDEE